MRSRAVHNAMSAMRTVVIYNPRAIGIPAAVAREFGEVYPGEVVTAAQGNKVASTTSLFDIVVAGGRAIECASLDHGGATPIRHQERRHRRRGRLLG